MSTKIFHPLLAMIASATDRELAKQVQYLKEENKILRARIPGQIQTKPAERERLIKFGKRNRSFMSTKTPPRARLLRDEINQIQPIKRTLRNQDQ